MPQTRWKPLVTKEVIGTKPPPPKLRGRLPGGDGMPEVLMKMAVGQCYDINRSRLGIMQLATRLRHIYDVERKWIVRPSGKAGFSRVWRIK